MKLERPIVFFDVETTGLDIKNDRIIELAMIKLNPDGNKAEFYAKINPQGRAITPEAFSKHGMTLESLKDEPTFEKISPAIIVFIKGADFGGFNCAHFDIPILIEEFIRVQYPFKASEHRIVDVYKILMKAEQRTLSETYKRFMGKELDNAHSALSDIHATIDIMEALEQNYTLPETPEELHTFALGNDMIDFSNKLKKNDKGQMIFNFGKYKNQVVREVFKTDPGYFKWVLSTDLTEHTRSIFLNIISILESQK